ncbi:MAG: hypothetical protein PHI97_24365 [Desulfobulbus sp.]|nr:hypothetical protein [Desulfobulbus sp.]
MKTSIFKTPRRGWLGNKPLGADYMPAVNELVRRLKAVLREDQGQPADKRQQRLPGF